MASGIWGAVAGLGKGISENAQTNIKLKNDKDIMDHEMMKREALARVESELRIQGNTQNNLEQSTARTAQIAQEAELTGENQEAADKRTSKEKKLDRQAEISLQKLRNKGAVDAASSRLNTPKVKIADRFAFKNQQGGEAAGWSEVTTLQDKVSKRVYQLNGDRFDVSGFKTDASTPKPNEKAYEALNNAIMSGKEEVIDQFADKFGYLPAYAIRALPQFTTSADDSETTDYPEE